MDDDDVILVRDRGKLTAWTNVDGLWMAVTLPDCRPLGRYLTDVAFNETFPCVVRRNRRKPQRTVR